MASLYKRGCRWWIQFYHNGKPKRFSTKTGNRKIAEKMRTMLEFEQLQGMVPYPLTNKHTLSDLKDLIVRDYKKKKRDLKPLMVMVNRLLKCFDEDEPIISIKSAEIENFIDDMTNKGFKNATINRHLQTLRRMFSLGKKRNPPFVYTSPTIELLDEDNVKTRFLTIHEYVKLRNEIAPYLKTFIAVAFTYGLRSGRIRSLKWDEVDMEQDRWRLRLLKKSNKKKTPKLLLLTKDLNNSFKEMWANRPKTGPASEFVFLNVKRTGPIVNYRRAWNKACRDAEIGYGYAINREYKNKYEEGTLKPGPTLHDCRRAAVRNVIRSGSSKKQGKTMSGHKSDEVFDNYDVIDEADMINTVNRLEAYLDKEYDRVKNNIDNS